MCLTLRFFSVIAFAWPKSLSTVNRPLSTKHMIVVTGAAGFIGSCLVSKLNQEGYNFIIAVDDFSKLEKLDNLEGKTIQERVERSEFFDWLDKNQEEVEFIFHIGARTDTTEFDRAIFEELNVQYSKEIWNRCVAYQIPLVYASSAATYGLGEQGYLDDESLIPQLHPLNPYGDSKNEFDLWALAQEKKPFFWAGLKFFNVYGPNEYHKGVKDVVDVCCFLMDHRKDSGIYNLGSGQARTFKDLVTSTFHAMQIEPDIDFIDTPADIRDKYQYFTEASMDKLRAIGYDQPFHSLEEGIEDYVVQYLSTGTYY